MKLVIRCDAGPAVGLGHAGRSIALAEELAERLSTVPRMLAPSDPVLERFLAGRGVELRRLETAGYALPEVLDELSEPAVIVSDSYELDEAALAAIAAAGAVHVVVDDFARLGSWPCRLVVNPNLGGESLSYPGAGIVLAGSRYALVRREVREAARRRREGDAGNGRLLLCLGGSTWAHGGERVLAEVAHLAAEGIEVRAAVEHAGLGHAVPNGVAAVPQSSLPDQLAWADAAILSGGVVKYEAATIGVPALLLAVVPHQEGVAKAFAATGAAEYLGSIASVDPAAVSRSAVALLRDPQRRARLSNAARAVVDGRGAERVAEAALRGGN